MAQVVAHHLGDKAILIGGHATLCAGTIQGKVGRIQVLAGLAPSSQTVGSNTGARTGCHLASKLGEGEKSNRSYPRSLPGGKLFSCRWPVDELIVDELSSMSHHFLASSMSCRGQ